MTLVDSLASSSSSEVTVGATLFILASILVGLVFSLAQFSLVRKIKVGGEATLASSSHGSDYASIQEEGEALDSTRMGKIEQIYNAVREGADGFIVQEYSRATAFSLGFSVLVFFLTSREKDDVSGDVEWKWEKGLLTTLAFVVGCVTSMFCGFLGMKVAVFSNARTTISCASPNDAYTLGFNTSFRAGSVVGFGLVSATLASLYILLVAFNRAYPFEKSVDMFECVTGFGLGGSCIALFGRVGGGIFTKAADVGADLAGKVVNNIPEDDPRNPAVIADNVGDNVGDVAGAGSDLFGSLAEATCASLILAHASRGLVEAGWTALMLPLIITALGIFVCMLCTLVPTFIKPVKEERDIELTLKWQLFLTALGMTAVLYPVIAWALPSKFELQTVEGLGHVIEGTPFKAFGCTVTGLWAGTVIGFITEYYTSHTYNPTREVAMSAETGAATVIIYGMALGYKSCVAPVFLIAATVYVSFNTLDMYGVSLAAIGMLSTLTTALTIDVFGPISDNAGGIAEMANLPERVREVTDSLDAAGNTTAAIGKGFAIGSACLVGLALFGAFVRRCGMDANQVSVLNPVIFSFLLVGAMIPYWFSAMTMKSVGFAAKAMVMEVKRQFDTIPGLLEGTPGHAPADYAKCIKIATDAALKEMVPPAILILSTPILTGVLFGTGAVAGLLAGAIASSVQLAIAMSNAGGAWDNSKKFVEKGMVVVNGQAQKKGSEWHKSVVVGDTVGDPFKDTSGPALNIVMKLMAVLSLVFADFFMSINSGKGLIHWKE
ncbi:V-type H(+)-translocating pyrophosphatase [Batrachochytrium salamandrivorans]|nr:V-type H(+)-translocating pyrophosphatase [Batrachochytrium salamandrivorans]